MRNIMKTGKELSRNLDTFIQHIDSIKDTLPMAILLILPYNEEAIKDFYSFMKYKTEEIIEDDGTKKKVVKADEMRLYEKLEHNAAISSLATKIITESLFVSLISQYDAFLTRLLKSLFEIKPEVLNQSDKNLTFSQLVNLESIEKAREYIVNKEIETVLRKSHSEHFEYLENLFKLKLREKLPIWKTFIEITERRNLFVHSDGIISDQYLKKCHEHDCEINPSKVGERLEISIEYFLNACNCLYEISVKLTHTLWRKLLPNDLELADDELNDICFNLINSNRLKLADILLDFAINQKKHFNEISKNVFIINCSLSKHMQGDKKSCGEILKARDWSACSDNFQLANEVLTDNFDKAYEIMKRIGKDGCVHKSFYKTWPLFYNIHKEGKFKEVFKEIFDEEYTKLEIPQSPAQSLISEQMKKNKRNKLKQKKNKKTE